MKAWVSYKKTLLEKHPVYTDYPFEIKMGSGNDLKDLMTKQTKLTWCEENVGKSGWTDDNRYDPGGDWIHYFPYYRFKTEKAASLFKLHWC